MKKAIQSRSVWSERRPSRADSWSVWLASLPARTREAKLEEILRDLVDEKGVDDAEALEHLHFDWHFWARTNQLEPTDFYFVWFCMCGRGWGKTRTGAEVVRSWAEDGVELMALVAETPGDARDVMVLGPSGIIAVSPPWFRPLYEPTKRLLQWPRLRDDWIVRPGPQGHIYSGSNPDQLRGPQHGRAWVDELPKFPYASEVYENLLFGLRDADAPKLVITTTPKPIALLKKILSRESTVVTSGSSYDNRRNLTPIFYSEVIEPLEGTEIASQEIYARLLDEAASAMWKRAEIEKHRIPAPDDLAGKLKALKDAGITLERIAVAIDPAAKSKKTSSETGIIGGGIATNGHGYVLQDTSGRFTPARWAARTVATFDALDADVVVYEANQGGDMVAHTLHGERAALPLREVSASRAKQARAEPVSLKAEKGEIHHVGMFEELEDQLCTWVPEPGAESPDHLDAFVWLFTHLMIGPRQVTRPRIPRLIRGE